RAVHPRAPLSAHPARRAHWRVPQPGRIGPRPRLRVLLHLHDEQDPRHGGGVLSAADCGALSNSATTRSVSEGLARASGWCPSLKDDALGFAGCGIENEERLRVGPMERTRIDHARPPSAVLGGDVRVAVEEIVVLVAFLELAEKPLVISVGEGDVCL